MAQDSSRDAAGGASGQAVAQVGERGGSGKAAGTDGLRTITYYAVARNPQGKIGQLLVTRVMSAPGVKVSGTQEWTGITYKTEREARLDMARLNCVARS